MLLFFFNDTARTEIYTLSLHDALPISLTRTHTHTHTHRSCVPDVLPFLQYGQADGALLLCVFLRLLFLVFLLAQLSLCEQHKTHSKISSTASLSLCVQCRPGPWGGSGTVS